MKRINFHGTVHALFTVFLAACLAGCPITPATVTVPDVVGMTQTAAQSAITGAGLAVGTVTEAFSDSVAAGQVISQNPASGASVAPANAVALVVSKGPEPLHNVTVPDVVGMGQSAAQGAIMGAGLAVGTVTESFSDSVAAGHIISQSPAAGASAAPASAVNLLVSKGPEPLPSVTVPDVVGMGQSAAQGAITGAGLAVGTVTEAFSASVPAGQVISQNPASGASVAPASAVNLLVSKGPEPVTVPDVVGMTQSEAQGTLTGAGLALGTVTETFNDSVPEGDVISQSPEAGASVPPASTVNLLVSKGREPLAEAVEMPGWTFTSGGAADWFTQADTFYYGGSAARNCLITHSQESWMETVVIGPGTLTFHWKVSSESGYDLLEFHLDSVRQSHISGSMDWTQKVVQIPDFGEQTLRWRYVKDSSVSSGSDCGWVDYVQWLPAMPTLTLLQPNGGEAWYPGIQETIRWQSKGDVGDYVRLDLFHGEKIHSRTITESQPNAPGENTFTWTVPQDQAIGVDYYVQVKSASKPEVLDLSDGVFSVDVNQTIYLPGNVPLVMVPIPGGTYLMGRYPGEQDSYSEEDPQHSVTVPGFWMAKYELTKRQWKAVMGTEPWAGQSWVLNDLDSPAVYVSWNDAKAFITALNTHTGLTFRLPSESEWEYAARAGTATRFYWGDDPSYTEISNYAWWTGNAWNIGNLYAHVVGQKLPNAFGLYDMSGNVWEWCEDDWHGNYNGAPSNGSPWVNAPRGSYRVLRGGSWNSSGSGCRSAARAYQLPSNAYSPFGFRLSR